MNRPITVIGYCNGSISDVRSPCAITRRMLREHLCVIGTSVDIRALEHAIDLAIETMIQRISGPHLHISWRLPLIHFYMKRMLKYPGTLGTYQVPFSYCNLLPSRVISSTSTTQDITSQVYPIPNCDSSFNLSFCSCQSYPRLPSRIDHCIFTVFNLVCSRSIISLSRCQDGTLMSIPYPSRWSSMSCRLLSFYLCLFVWCQDRCQLVIWSWSSSPGSVGRFMCSPGSLVRHDVIRICPHRTSVLLTLGVIILHANYLFNILPSVGQYSIQHDVFMFGE